MGVNPDQYNRNQEDKFGLLDFGTGRKDPFRKFYDKASDDYIFKLSNLPEAFEKLEQEQPEGVEHRKLSEVFEKSKDAR